jgi:hypothetical protein
MLTRFIVFLYLATTLFGSHSANAKGGLGDVFNGIIGVITGQAVGAVVADSQTIESGLRKMADKVNAQMPMVVDRDTQIDTITAGPGARFTYNYTLVRMTSKEVDREDLMHFMRTNVKSSVCSSPNMQTFFRNKVTVGYSYRASDGVHIGKIDITPRDCGYGK